MMSEVRVVPSGKVYRQIFDAEVQLVRTLGETRRKSVHHGDSFENGRIPIVRNLDTPPGQILSLRQRTWMKGLLNDGFTENPVLHRDAVLSAIKPKAVVELDCAVREVKGLPDVIVPAKIGSTIIQQLAEVKQKSYETAITKLEDELATISGALENQFTEAAERLLQEVEESHQTVHKLLSSAENDSNVSALAFQELWEVIMKQTLQRREWIKELDRTYKEYEKERVKQITAVFKDCVVTLEKNTYLLPDDIYQYIDKEAMLVNQALLANHRAMNKLNVNLIEADLKQELSDRQEWNTKVENLKALKKHDVLQRFNDFLVKDWNAGLAMDKELLKKEQQGLNNKRVQLLEDIIKLNPSDCNKASITEWYDSLKALNLQIDSLHIQYISKVQAYYEKLYRDWMIEIDRCKEELVRSRACTEEEAKQLMITNFLPLVGNLQRQFEEEQSSVDQHMESLAKYMNFQCKVIYNICKGAAQLWEVHKKNLDSKEHQLKRQLDECRNKHDKLNQAREAQLDMLIDQLRQRDTQSDLKADHKKAVCMLDMIKKGYKSFYQKLLNIVNNYPSMSEKELYRFSTAISKYFEVNEIYKLIKLKIIIQSPSMLKVNILNEDASVVSEEITEESDRSQSTIGELSTDQPLSFEERSEEEVELLGHEQTPQYPGLSVEGDHKWKNADGSRNISDQSVPESALSQYLSEFEYEGEDAFFLKPRSNGFDGTNQDQSVIQFECFRTSRGNTYSVLREKITKDMSNEFTFLTDVEEQKYLLDYMKYAFLPEEMFLSLKKRIRINIFEHLEDWCDKAMENASNIIVIKKKEFKAEFELQNHLHEPRAKRIKMDVLNVRAVELRLHKQKVERHCKGVDEALKKLKNVFIALQAEHCKYILKFNNSIYALEDIFKSAVKSDRLLTLVNSLQSKQDKYMENVDTLLRNFQQKLDKSLAKLHNDNERFIVSFRLFAEGGNFSPPEIDMYHRSLEKTTISIAKTEGTIMVDLEIMQAMSLEQSTVVIKAVEEKFMRYTTDLMFIEKIKRFLTNTQARIKSEVAISNYNMLNITSYIEKFAKKIDACARPNLDKETVSPKELYNFSKVIGDLMKKNTSYLNCLAEPALTKTPLQGPISTATFQKEETKVGFSINENLLVPTRKGRTATDDAAVGVIKELLNVHKSEVLVEAEPEATEDQGAARGSQSSFVSASPNAHSPGGSSRGQKTASTLPSALKYSKPNRLDAKYHVFGETAEKSDHFKGIITYILWENTNGLLAVAEDYYKKKERTPVYRPEYLKDTFEQCADELIQKMQSYQTQSDIYHINCLQEFREQLKVFEQLVASMPQFLFEEVLEQHTELIARAMAEIRSTFAKKQQQLENSKMENEHRLRPILGHPNNWQNLESLCRKEEERQDNEAEDIFSSAEKLKQCRREHAMAFVSAISCLSEQLLLEFDDFTTVDDVQAAGEAVKEPTVPLIRLKLIESPLQEQDYYPTFVVDVPRDSRVWPGIPAFELSYTAVRSPVSSIQSAKSQSVESISMETAAVTTAKTVLAHMATVEARDAAYVKYKKRFLQEMTLMEHETNGQLINAQRWQDGWRDSVLNIKKLYAQVRTTCNIPVL
uniref:coiled-coil domain-containing protein 180 isoform X2 n=1 Tax=Pristiophorus japonicus TaxID=55135 RepID=UPI00398F31EA